MQGQCLCGYLEFKIKIPNLTFHDSVSNYKIRFDNAPLNLPKDSSLFLNKNSFHEDTLIIEIPTYGGIKTLIFEITDLTNDKSMVITSENLSYDVKYKILIDEFEEGNYLFEWNKINKCQLLYPNDSLIECDKLKFYQLHLKSEEEKKLPGNFAYNEIKPCKLDYFKIDE